MTSNRSALTALGLIAMVLTGHFVLTFVVPAVYLRNSENDIRMLASACWNARDSLNAANSAQSLGPDQHDRLIHAAQIEMLNCVDLGILFSRLEAAGVRRGRLNELNLVAGYETGLSTEQLTEPYGQP